MNLPTALRMAWRSIRANRMRSILTMLGIVIGVASVILLVAAGHATKQAVQKQLDALGTNVLTLQAGGDDFFDQPVGAAEPQLTDRDLAAVRALGPAQGVASAHPVLSPTVTLQNGVRSLSVGQFIGTDPGYQTMSNLRYATGRGFTQAEEHQRQRVVVLGSKLATRLFGPGRGAGQSLTANGVRFNVVGVLVPRGGDTGSDDSAIAPYTATRDNLSGPSAPLASIAIEATDTKATKTARGPMVQALRVSRALRPSDSDDFSIYDQASLLGTSNTIASVLSLVLGGVAATSLFVGGMGVMNIMLVTVIERTREIGIRKAIGARRDQIIMQFLIEAVVLCLMGGLTGVLVGITAAVIASAATGYDASVGPGAILLALGVSTIVGMGFGLYPARRAASLRPIDALRYE